MLRLRYDTPAAWVAIVEAELDAFLQDHAANERKVAGSALTLLTQHYERVELVDELVAVACEELAHFKLLYDLLRRRGLGLAQDAPDPYMTKLRKRTRSPDKDEYLLDRLLLFGIVEARGCERFAMLADGLSDEALRAMYRDLAQSEARHHATYYRLAKLYFDEGRVRERADELLELEAAVVAELPLSARLH